MPAPAPSLATQSLKALRALGASLRARRKALGLSAVATAEAAGLSRVTLYRIEKGEPSVAMGAYLNVADALGLDVALAERGAKTPTAEEAAAKLPRSIRPADYPQLKKLAWQLRKTKALTPEQTLELYERNWRHVDADALTAKERQLIALLTRAFGRERLLV